MPNYRASPRVQLTGRARWPAALGPPLLKALPMDPTVEATALEVLVFPILWGMLGSCGVGATALFCVKAIDSLSSRMGGGRPQRSMTRAASASNKSL